MNNITEQDLNILQHMLGIREAFPRDIWGFRNYYAPGPIDALSMERLQTAGLIRPGRPYNETTYFHATEAGCKRAGLTEKQTKTALDRYAQEDFLL